MTQMEILRVIDTFCKKNGIQYSLYAGTLLGAVRHEGFIPWDDDLDICMERSEYERFLREWEEQRPEGYILQNKENTPAFTQSFSKIRKEHTTFLQYEWERGRYHTGIFVDVFPIDRLPGNGIRKLKFRMVGVHYQLLTREFVPPKASLPVKIASWLILAGSPLRSRQRLREKDLAYLTAFHDDENQMIAIETLRTLRQPLPPNMMDGYSECCFEGSSFPVIENWDAYLRCKFGDYMTLPPESERAWKHHPIALDFEHDLDELS
jgi:lipopolysaccharide cholinephosphotransferase